MWIRHFHGYGIGALCPPVSVKLENVFVCWISLLLFAHGWREGGRAVGGRHRVTRTLEWVSFWGSGNRDKQGSDDDDDDGGTWTVPNVLLSFIGLVMLDWKFAKRYMMNLASDGNF